MIRLLQILIISVTMSEALHAGNGGNVDFMGIYNACKNLSSDSLDSIGRRCLNRNETDTAMAVFTIIANRVGDEAGASERSYISAALNSLGIISFMHGDYADAYSKFHSSSEYADSLGSPAHINLASIYWLYGDYLKAYELLKIEFFRAIEQKNLEHAGFVIVNFANIFPERNLPGKRDEIISMLKRFGDEVSKMKKGALADEIHYKSLIGKALLNSLEGNHSEAIKLYKSAIPYGGAMVVRDRELFSTTLLAGNEFRSLGMTDSALVYYRNAEDIASRGGFRELSMEVYKEMSATYLMMGDKALALIYKYRHLELNDSINNILDFSKIRDLEASYAAQKFQTQLDTIKARDALRTRTLWVVSVAGIILAALLIYLVFQNRVLKRKNQVLFTKNLEGMEQPHVTDNVATQSVAEADMSGNEAVSPKYADSSLSNDKKEQLEEAIRRVMSDENNFCREGFSLNTLAELCDTNPKYVSQVLNEKMNKTFTQFLNEVRVDVARRRMVDFEHYGHLTLEALVAGVGFKSRSTFSKTFKRLTGLTPSEFQKMAREHSKAS